MMSVSWLIQPSPLTLFVLRGVVTAFLPLQVTLVPAASIFFAISTRPGADEMSGSEMTRDTPPGSAR